jgi:putative flippase GtrA
MMVHRQLFRFALVGLASNLLLYLAYLVITALDMGHKTAMTVVYVTGVCLTFALNRQWTFSYHGPLVPAFGKYVVIYLAGYLVNWFGLFVLVDRLGFDHRAVQACMVILVALFMFFAQRRVAFGHGQATGPKRSAAVPRQ